MYSCGKQVEISKILQILQNKVDENGISTHFEDNKTNLSDKSKVIPYAACQEEFFPPPGLGAAADQP